MTPPKKIRGGIPKFTAAVNEVIAEVAKGRTIPVHGFDETPSGILPPPQSSGYTPQFAREVYNEDDTTYFRFLPSGGYVHVPYYGGTADDQLPNFEYFAVEPTIGGETIIQYDPDEPPPRLELTRNQVNLIVLDVTMGSRDEDIGDLDYAGGHLIKNKVTDDSISIPSTTGSGGDPSHQHSIGTGSFTGVIATPLQERNWACFEGATVEFNAIDLDDYTKDPTSEIIRRLCGWYYIDPEGAVLSSRWFVDGHIDIHRPPHMVTNETEAEDRNPTGPSVLAEEDEYTIPGTPSNPT